ncbi:Cdc6/Cdc18 family protein [Haloquadratum walsbyi]|uniref:ORC1-type DNA replication protein n=1 Tax=Haloquadratum walsbyi (strain DSM 16854 / JCM 12705 / C23) TaxID=768065 RepID=G0LFW4_HALWC|nr:ORC1-type DNA replication protein [Haloquadratum walsbyi]CCC38984.1 Orc1-type DNA replication protein [Haloquadratum walsbyi C23]
MHNNRIHNNSSSDNLESSHEDKRDNPSTSPTESGDFTLDEDMSQDNNHSDTANSNTRNRTSSASEDDIDHSENREEQGLFDNLLSGEPIFENKEVLRPSYTPRKLPHRTEQINQMATILVSALRGDTPSNILIYGKTGTGKTASAKFVSQELESTSQKYDVACEVEYINCEVTDTQYRVLAQLANKFIEKNRNQIDKRIDELKTLQSSEEYLSGSASSTESIDSVDTADDTISKSPDESTGEYINLSDIASPFDSARDLDDRIESLRADREEMELVPMTGWPTDRVYSTFFDAVDYHERVAVIMLDEVDKLVEKSGDDTLYNLSRMNSELDNSRISIIGISNDLKFTDFLDPRVKSSLGEEEIVFPPYDANQLRDILQYRADVSFKSDALTDDVIPLCAAFAAQEHGDARRALDLLRTAGELAERSQTNTVEEDHVRQAQDKIELDRVIEVVRTLPTQSKIVLYSIILLEKNGVHSINTGEVFNIYKRLCEELDTDVLTQRRVTDLISELDMLGIVNAIVVSKGRYGRTKEISLSVPIEETETVLLSDSRLGNIENAQPFVQARFDN